ncbi:hypothetical protein M5D96_000414 [Drosophila gunungcola]|uniref:Uncharacterized protein n=1 Tax=Drosophila gunungcola TaxID=103775 RepID=A0A9P9YWP9_9MUSC|nr:hypothetical protein M5D96_000414 [Drosophila gunungcola]
MMPPAAHPTWPHRHISTSTAGMQNFFVMDFLINLQSFSTAYQQHLQHSRCVMGLGGAQLADPFQYHKGGGSYSRSRSRAAGDNSAPFISIAHLNLDLK